MDGCSQSIVSDFSTHTLTLYLSGGRYVGPSPDDGQSSTDAGVPGLLYDHLGYGTGAPGVVATCTPPACGAIPAHYPLDQPAILSHVGPDRRDTP